MTEEIPHICHAVGCTKKVPPKLFMCGYHWKLLPASLKRSIWRHYRPGQEVDKSPSHAYVVAAEAAREWLRKVERK